MVALLEAALGDAVAADGYVADAGAELRLGNDAYVGLAAPSRDADTASIPTKRADAAGVAGLTFFDGAVAASAENGQYAVIAAAAGECQGDAEHRAIERASDHRHCYS